MANVEISLTKHDDLFKQCTHADSCLFPVMTTLAIRFEQMRESDQSCTARCMLLALSAPTNQTNRLFKSKNCSFSAKYSTVRTRYTIRGQPVCIPVFSLVLNLSTRNSEIAKEVSECEEFLCFRSERGIHRRGTMADQSKVGCSFLTGYAELNLIPCPRGRSSADEIPLLLLPSSTTYTAVYNEYKQQWFTIAVAAVVEKFITNEPDSPLLFQQFKRVWKEYFSTLRIAPLDSEFCDFCRITNNEMTYASDDTKTLCIERLNFHKDRAKQGTNRTKQFPRKQQ